MLMLELNSMWEKGIPDRKLLNLKEMAGNILTEMKVHAGKCGEVTFDSRQLHFVYNPKEFLHSVIFGRSLKSTENNQIGFYFSKSLAFNIV